MLCSVRNQMCTPISGEVAMSRRDRPRLPQRLKEGGRGTRTQTTRDIRCCRVRRGKFVPKTHINIIIFPHNAVRLRSTAKARPRTTHRQIQFKWMDYNHTERERYMMTMGYLDTYKKQHNIYLACISKVYFIQCPPNVWIQSSFLEF